MTLWLAIASGGALGALARHGVNVLVARGVGASMPYATAIVNIVGCALIGAIAGWAASGGRLSLTTQAFLMVGVLGGFTTFSSLGLDTLTLVHQGRGLAAFANVTIQLVLGLGAVFAAFALTNTR